MAPLRFKQVDVFTRTPLRGNPVAVVLGADSLSGEAMQRIAGWTNHSETTFVLPPLSGAADYRLRTDLANLQARKIDREGMELETLKMKRLYQMALDQEVARIDEAIAGFQRRLDQLEKAFGVRSGYGPALPPLSGGVKEQAVE